MKVMGFLPEQFISNAAADVAGYLKDLRPDYLH